MGKFDGHMAQAATPVHRVLDALARLGLIPRELFSLAPHSLGFLSIHAGSLWRRMR
jgi:hypothetical protein